MTVKLRTKKPDPYLKQIIQALEKYNEEHPRAVIEAYRQNNVSVRVRIVSPDFQGKSRAEREEGVWAHLEKLPEDVVADVSVLLLLTPREAKDSFASYEFDHPTPSQL